MAGSEQYSGTYSYSYFSHVALKYTDRPTDRRIYLSLDAPLPKHKNISFTVSLFLYNKATAANCQNSLK